MKKIDILRKERDAVLGLIDHGKKTGQDNGAWFENLEKEFNELEKQIGKELRKI